MKFIFYTIKGLEDVSKKELEAFGVDVNKVETKKLFGEFNGELENLKNLRTIEDVAIIIDRIKLKSNFIEKEILEKVDAIDFTKHTKLISKARDINNTFSITLSKYKAKVDIDSLKNKLGINLADRLNLVYTENDHENIDIRLHVEKKELTISLRLFQKPLHRREYVSENYLGSLKPTIAASLCRMALEKVTNYKDTKLVDNFCGSGTILCESYVQGISVFGSDINPSAVDISDHRLRKLGSKNHRLVNQSAFSTNWEENMFNLAISNPPWDEQLAISSITELYSKMMQEYKRILSEDAVLCFIAKKPDLLIKHIKLNFPNHKIETRKISFNGQQPTIVIACTIK